MVPAINLVSFAVVVLKCGIGTVIHSLRVHIHAPKCTRNSGICMLESAATCSRTTIKRPDKPQRAQLHFEMLLSLSLFVQIRTVMPKSNILYGLSFGCICTRPTPCILFPAIIYKMLDFIVASSRDGCRIPCNALQITSWRGCRPILVRLYCVSGLCEPFGRLVTLGLDAKIAMSGGKEHNELLCRSVEGENKYIRIW